MRERSAAALFFALALCASPLAAQKKPTPGRAPGAVSVADACPPTGSRSICFPRIASEFTVLRGGDVMVVESLTVRFEGEWNGIERLLREDATRAEGGYRDIDIEVLAATDASGNQLRLDEDENGDVIMLRIWVPGAADATHTVVLRYRIEEGVTFFDEHDEFYWNVLGPESTAPVASARARVIVPEGATGLRAEAFAGPTGSSDPSPTQVEGSVAVATSAVPLGPGIPFTVVVGWDPGLVERPSGIELFFDWLKRFWSLALPVLSLVFMWRLWSRRGRDPQALAIVTQYEPPAGVTPGEVGTLLDEKADMRDITATMVDLAVQGHMRIDEVEGKKILGMEFGEDYAFVQTAPPGSARPMKPHEARLHSALFAGRDRVELSDLKNEFYKDLPGIRESLMDCMLTSGVYTRRPDRVRAAWVAGAFAIGIALFFLLGFTGAATLALFVVPILTALPVMVLGWLMPARTVKGTRLIESLRGFREFLSRVDGDRLRRMKIDSTAFERILPFAMAMGVEKKWGEAFEGLAQDPPNWYRSRRGATFHPALFVNDLGRMSSASASTMQSAPRSSGSGGSGFGGGGSSGGGGGGGGVGGF